MSAIGGINPLNTDITATSAPVVAASPPPPTPTQQLQPQPLLLPDPKPSVADTTAQLPACSASPSSSPSLIGGGSGRAGVGAAGDTSPVIGGLDDIVVQQPGLLPVGVGSGCTSESNVAGSDGDNSNSCDDWSGMDFDLDFESTSDPLGADLADLPPWSSVSTVCE